LPLCSPQIPHEEKPETSRLRLGMAKQKLLFAYVFYEYLAILE
jgi:hypothetical protein